VEATYGYDLADRQVGLSVTTPSVPSPATEVVQGAGYLPGGPLAVLTLGNGTSETRTFDERYHPESIALTAPRNRTWSYGIDAVGNVTEIVASGDCPGDVVLSNLTVNGAEVHASCATLAAGPDVTVAATGDLDLTAATRVVIKDGFAVENGGRLAVGTDPSIVYEETKSYGYRDTHYFLTSADGPWGSLGWTYDRVGNRLTETDDAVTDTYSYTPNAGGGNTALLDEIALGATASSRTFTYSAAGHQETSSASGNTVTFTYDDEGRLQHADRTGGDACPFVYDGRSYLRQAGDLATTGTVQPTYDSAGLLYSLLRQEAAASTPRRYHLLSLAGRPVAQLATESGQADRWWYLTTDHLATPLLATSTGGTELWESAFEPFGEDGAAATAAGALENEIFHRFPGQWEDELWREATMGAGVAYNLHRWYAPGTARYSRTDPLFFTLQDVNAYSYARANPLVGVDPLGLQTYHCTRPLGKPPGPKSPPPIINHQYACFLESNGTYTCDSTSKRDPAGTFLDNLLPGEGNNPRDVFDPKRCTQVEPKNTCLEDCLRALWSQPRSTYAVGPLGEDCQEYTRRLLYDCRVACGLLPPRHDPANPGRPGFRESPF
jgi:RHS repeat-associated protein